MNSEVSCYKKMMIKVLLLEQFNRGHVPVKRVNDLQCECRAAEFSSSVVS